jgi:hypothetical protein
MNKTERWKLEAGDWALKDLIFFGKRPDPSLRLIAAVKRD